MSKVFVHGLGAVSPAGWGVAPLLKSLEENSSIPTQTLSHFQVRTVPPPNPRPTCLNHPRLRRASPISQYATAAAHEALGDLRQPNSRLGIVVGVHAASIRYSDRFFGEVLRDPSTASPLVFPETVINAPASHLAATLSATHLSYSVLGDQTAFIQALAIGAHWLAQDRADLVLVIASEETDWLVSNTAHLFARDVICSEGAGALTLAREPTPDAIELTSITDPLPYSGESTRLKAAKNLSASLSPQSSVLSALLCDSRTGSARWDHAENTAWHAFPGPILSPRKILGEALSAATAWQFIAACGRLRRGLTPRAIISAIGSNQQAIGATLQLSTSP